MLVNILATPLADDAESGDTDDSGDSDRMDGSED